MTAFAELGVMPEIVQAIENDLNWLLPSDIQAEAVPLILGGGDVLMAAETGRGKTGAFCIPMLQIVAEVLRAQQEEKHRPSKVAKVAASDTPPVQMSSSTREPLFAVSADGMLCQSRSEHNWQGGRGNYGVTSGKCFYEVEMTDEGLCRVGWATDDASFNLGTDAFGFGFGGTGKKSNNRQFLDYGAPFGKGDVLGVFIDMDACTIHFSKNGQPFETAFEVPKAALKGKPLYPACALKNAELKFNFGAQPFRFTPEKGYASLHSQVANLTLEPQKAVPTAALSSKGPVALILEPSKELASQTRRQIQMFKRHIANPPIRDCLLIGGVSAKDQLATLKKGVEVVVGTPGRILDFVNTGKLDLSRVGFFILDEVDGLLAQGHEKLIDQLYQKMPKDWLGRRLQLIVASATLHSPLVRTFAETNMFHPTWIDLKGMDAVPDTVHHVVYHVDPRKDDSWKGAPPFLKTDGMHNSDNLKSPQAAATLSQAVKLLKPNLLLALINKHQMDQAIVFCRTKLDCDNLEAFLKASGGGGTMVNEYSAVCVHGDRNVKERTANLQAFKDGEARFLICTDVAARGIDIQGIPFVVNMTLPDEKEQYVHRIGRVGRADRMGLAISLVSRVQEKVWYHSCPSRGRGCKNTKLTTQGGCAIWYDEPQLLSDIQEHLGVVIPELDDTLEVPVNEFDGKVVYGAAKSGKGTTYQGHAAILAPSVRELAELEHAAQTSYLSLQVEGFGTTS
eukprot:m.44229 g.44229  ORF g.44229 m.44229 type:complete len:734 (-) comp10825_c1_seq6:1035-3236(-)